MKAWVIGSEPGSSGLRLAEQPTPQPRDGEVLVRIDAISLNYRDLLVTKGSYHKGTPPADATPCSDAAGQVVDVGVNVTSLRAGDRVMSMFAPDWLGGSLSRKALKTTLGSGSGPGVLAEHVALPEHAFIRVPHGWSSEQASTLPCAGLTAWHALFEEAPIDSGSSILVLGAGGVSVFALQMARAAGARVLAISSSDVRLDRLRNLGASGGVNYRHVPHWGEAVRELAGGEGVDLVLEVGGAGTFDESCRAVRPGGTVALIGTLAGPAAVNLTPALLRNIRIQGTTVGSREMCERMVATLANWRLDPVIDEVFEFAEAPRAFQRLESGAHFGKVVIQVN